MALKPHYTIDGRRWLPLARAATLLGMNGVGIKRMMASGDLDWCQLRPGSTTFLVDEAAVFALRLARAVPAKQRARLADATADTAAKRGRSMLAIRPAISGSKPYSVLEPTWDPSPVARPISGRDQQDPPKR